MATSRIACLLRPTEAASASTTPLPHRRQPPQLRAEATATMDHRTSHFLAHLALPPPQNIVANVFPEKRNRHRRKKPGRRPARCTPWPPVNSPSNAVLKLPPTSTFLSDDPVSPTSHRPPAPGPVISAIFLARLRARESTHTRNARVRRTHHPTRKRTNTPIDNGVCHPDQREGSAFRAFWGGAGPSGLRSRPKKMTGL